MNHSKPSEHTGKSGCLKKVCVDKYHFKVDRMGRDTIKCASLIQEYIKTIFRKLCLKML